MKWSVAYGETVLNIECDTDLRSEVLDEVVANYTQLLNHIHKNPLFLSSYEPIEASEDDPGIVRMMCDASARCGVGPMAAVAGTFSEIVGRKIHESTSEYIVDNGGDIYMSTGMEKVVGVHTPSERFSDKIRFLIDSSETPLGICSSSSKIGHSVSMGSADTVVAFSDSAAVADAAATAIANSVKGPDSLGSCISQASCIRGLRGILIIVGDEMGAYGRLPKIVG
ncbi:MAG: UPF0280 family protein [Candidatus Altiarchaeota archaeon]